MSSAIRDAFKDWIWKDPERRETLVRQYNEEMNSTRPREYDGSHIVFSGMNPEITLREHQKNAIAHVLYGGNIIDYTENPQKTDGGRLITSWQCDSRIADAEFLFAKNQYTQKTGRVRGEDDVIAYRDTP